MYGEIVVPKIATNAATYVGSSDRCGTKVPTITALQSGCANNAAPIYASRPSDSHLNQRSISAYKPNICSARMATPIGTTSNVRGIGTGRLIAAAIAPISAPALIRLARSSADTAAYTTGRGNRSRRTAASPRPVTIPILAHVNWTAAIIGNDTSAVQSVL